jgi:hypothetical protein
MTFQPGAFQSPGFQQRSYSGGTPEPEKKKFDSEAYAYVLNHADRLRQRVESLPEPVREAVSVAVEMKAKPDRDLLLKSRMANIELKFQRMYLELAEMYYLAMLEREAMERRRQDDELAILLLLS